MANYRRVPTKTETETERMRMLEAAAPNYRKVPTKTERMRMLEAAALAALPALIDRANVNGDDEDIARALQIGDNFANEWAEYFTVDDE